MEKLNELIEKANAQSANRKMRFMLVDYQPEVKLITITVYPDGYHLTEHSPLPVPRTIRYTSSVATLHLIEEACEFIENNLNKD